MGERITLKNNLFHCKVLTIKMIVVTIFIIAVQSISINFRSIIGLFIYSMIQAAVGFVEQKK